MHLIRSELQATFAATVDDGENEDAVAVLAIKNDVTAVFVATHTGSDTASWPTHMGKISQEGEGMFEIVFVARGLVEAKGLDPELKNLSYLGICALG